MQFCEIRQEGKSRSIKSADVQFSKEQNPNRNYNNMVFFCTNSQMNLGTCIPIIKLNDPFEIASAVHPRCKLFFPLTLLQHSLWSVVVVIVQYLSLYTNEKFSSELFATRPRVANNGGDHPDRKKKMKRAKLDTTGKINF